MRGQHTVKFGFELSIEGKNEYISGTSGGEYDELDKAIYGKYRWYNLEPYVQDQIKLRPNLTLTVGVRYSYFQPEWEKDNLINFFDPSRFAPTKASVVSTNGTIVPGTENFTNGLIRAGDGSPYGKEVFNRTFNDWGPRIEVAWDPTSTGKMSLRAGYGIIYHREGSWAEFSTSNPPFEMAALVFNTFLSNPAGTAASSRPMFPVSLFRSNAPWRLPQVVHVWRRKK